MQLPTAGVRICPKCWTLPNIHEAEVGGEMEKRETDWEKLREREKEQGRGQGGKKRRFALPMTNQS